MKQPTVMVGDVECDIPEVWHPSKILKGLHQVNDCVNNPSWDEGQPRGERSLMVFAKAHSVTVILKVEKPPLKLVVSGPTFDEAMAAMEATLLVPKCPWQTDDNPLGRVSKKKK